ncbi:MAG: FAD-dependent thymidylate synthase [Alphaproteobacteria bacterium]|nr:FAD-dependent thymidylate synthase [Alphaproteobacteria bacterium]
MTMTHPAHQDALPTLAADDSTSTETFTTKRPSVAALEEILFKSFPLLDHGFVRVIDYMGDDTAVVQAARVSYGRGTKRSSQDQALINYLMRHRHTTPFEMCDIKFHVKMPIFVARQWLRHRTASVNEYSARYSILSKEFYIPDIDHLAPQSTSNKQGRDGELSRQEKERILDILRTDATQAYARYEELMNCTESGDVIDPERLGLTRELARMNLTLNYYTEFYWKVNLHNLLHFLSLRADSHAQYEIRVYAELIQDLIKHWVPYSYEAFCNYRVGGVTLSRDAWKVIQRMLKGETVEQPTSGLGGREWSELMEILSPTS